MKVALLTDTHFGVRNDSILFQDYFKRFYDDIFFPTLRERGIHTLIHLGDLFDRRKFVNFQILNRTRIDFLERLEGEGIESHVIIGNHDTFFKSTNQINSVVELCSRLNGIHIYDEPEEIRVGGLDIQVIPWLNPNNMESGLRAIKRSKAPVLMGHLEITGFCMYKGSPCDHGLGRDTFDRYQRVFSGHFHHRSSDGNVDYLGSPYEMNFQDMGDSRGFHIFDTETLELEFIPNPYRMHFRLVYDDRDQTTHGDYLTADVTEYTDRYVKVIVTHKTDPYLFEKWLDRLYAANPADLNIIEGFSLEISEEVEAELEDPDSSLAAADTLTILNTTVDSMESEINKDKLKNVLQELWVEAVNTGKE
jgi:DNA repair exonuclease SbcCD nuclease subunit